MGTGGCRVKNIVDELFGEKIDITTWDDDPRILIKNVLSPAKVEEVLVDEDEKSATVVVPDYQLSLAIGKSGQNVRLAARLCGWKIDIKSHTQYFGDGSEEIPGDFQEDYEDDGIEYVGEDVEYAEDKNIDSDQNEMDTDAADEDRGDEIEK